MPQSPIPVATANLIPQGAKSVKNLTAVTTTQLKTTPGTLLGLYVGTAGAAGTINDITTGGTPGAANQVAVVPAVVGVVLLNIPCTTGISITTGAGQVVTSAWYI